MKDMDILGIGALLFDRIANVEYFPPVDGETFVSSLEVRPGGSAANFTVGCSRLGLKSGFIGVVGNDAEGTFLIDDLKKEGVDVSEMIRTEKCPTGQVYVVLNKEGKRMMFAFSGAANLLSERDINPNYLSSSKFIHLADLKNINPLKAAAKAAQAVQTRVSLNPGALIAVQGYEEIKELLSHTDVFISSQGELKGIFDTENIEFAIRKLLKSGPQIAAITLGHEGCMVVDAMSGIRRLAPFETAAVDTTGAGDAFCAGFLTALVEGKELFEAAIFANAVAALKVARFGARSLPRRKEVDEFLSERKSAD